MATIKEQIQECEYEIRQRQYAIDQYRLKKLALERERMNCHHVFSKPIKGYEHEGGECELCGINEVHAACQKL